MNATLSTGVAKISTKRKLKQNHVSTIEKMADFFWNSRVLHYKHCVTQGRGGKYHFFFFEDVFRTSYPDEILSYDLNLLTFSSITIGSTYPDKNWEITFRGLPIHLINSS